MARRTSPSGNTTQTSFSFVAAGEQKAGRPGLGSQRSRGKEDSSFSLLSTFGFLFHPPADPACYPTCTVLSSSSAQPLQSEQAFSAHCPNPGPCRKLQRQGGNSQAQEVTRISQHAPPRHRPFPALQGIQEMRPGTFPKGTIIEEHTGTF